MFKNLKDKLATQVNKTNQTLFSAILPTDSTLLSGDRTSSITSHDDNHENNRSRLDSAASDISQNSANYVSPSRQFMPPSDVESEQGGNESDRETNPKIQKLLFVYKNKFARLKNAYDEVEREKDHIKNILQQQQDISIKRQTELRQQMKLERKTKEQTESLYLTEIKSRETKIEELTQELTEQKNLVQSSQEEARRLREQNTKLESLLVRCTEKIKTHQGKQGDLIAERDHLLEQLQEKQTLIESMMKDRQVEDTSTVPVQLKEHSELDTNVLLYDKEKLESTRVYVQQLEADLELAKQQQNKSNFDEDIKRERDEFKQKYEELSVNNEQLINDKSNLETSNKQFQESLFKDKQQIDELSTEIEILKKSLSTENEQNRNSYDTLKTEYENLTNELHKTKQARDTIQSSLDEITQERTMYKYKYEQIQQHEHTDNQIDQTNSSLTKLQHDYTQLIQELDTQRREHSEKIATLRSQQQNESNHNLEELREENNRLKSQIENDRQILQKEFENTRQEELSVLENELKAAAKRAQDKITDLSSQINEYQEKINHLQQLLNEQTTKSNQYEEELKEKSSQIVELEKFKSQKDLTDEFNSLKEQHQQKSEELKSLQEKLDEKIEHIKNSDKQLEEKQNEIVQFSTTIETSQINNQQLLEQKDKEIDTLKQNLSDQQSLYDSLTNEQQSRIEKLNIEHQQIIEELKSEYDQHEEIDSLHQQLISRNSQLNEKDEQLSIYKTQLDEQQNLNSKFQQQHNENYSELEAKLNHILSEKTDLETKLDNTRIRIQTTESILNEKTSNDSAKLEQKIKEFETECDSYRNEIETLKSEIISLININEENTRRIDEFDNEKFNFEQEITEKDRQIAESNERIQELELTLKQTQESGTKLRKALQKMKESVTNKEQTNTQDADIQLQKTIDEYEKRLTTQEKEYNSKLKAMAKEMSGQIEEKEQNYKQQLHDFIQKHHKTEDDLTQKSEQRVMKAEERALISEREMSKMQEQLKEKQLDHSRIVQDLQIQIQKLIRQTPQTAENFTQTVVEEVDLDHSNNGQHPFVFEPTEVDYLKQIVLAYMTGTDRITMAKVISAVLRYTEDEKSLIIEHEKLRHARWINSPK